MPRRRHGLPGRGLRQRGAGGGAGGARGSCPGCSRGLIAALSPQAAYDPYAYSNDYDMHTGKCERPTPRACPRPAGSVGPARAVWWLLHCSSFSAGDPKQDLAYERQYEQQTYQVIPEVIKNFIQYFHKTVSDLIDQKVYELQASRVSSDVIDQKVYEIQDIYENRYNTILPADGNHCFNCDPVKRKG